MPLSDREERILQEIERRLYEQDPKFARGVAGTTLHSYALRNVRRGVALFVLGFVTLIAFFFRPAVPVGVAAFLMMLGGATFAYHNARRAGAEQLKALRDRTFVARFLGRLEEKMKGHRRRDES